MELIQNREAWNKGKLVGRKPSLKLKDFRAIRIYLQNAHAARDLGMSNLAIDSKPGGCDPRRFSPRPPGCAAAGSSSRRRRLRTRAAWRRWVATCSVRTRRAAAGSRLAAGRGRR